MLTKTSERTYTLFFDPSDEISSLHMIRVACHARTLLEYLRPLIEEESNTLGFDMLTEDEVFFAGLFHDMGKLVNKHYSYPREQRPDKCEHVWEGYKFLQDQGFPQEITISTMYHHEGWIVDYYLQSDQNLQGIEPLFNDPNISPEFKKCLLISHIIKIADEIDDALVQRGNAPKKANPRKFIENQFIDGQFRPDWRDKVMKYVESLS